MTKQTLSRVRIVGSKGIRSRKLDVQTRAKPQFPFQKELQPLEEQLAQRNAELAILNSLQAALASKLDMQAVYDLVGDKIRDIFQVEVVYIAIRNPRDINQIDFPYYVDRGNVLNAAPLLLGEGLTSKVILDRQPLLLGTMEEQIQLGAFFESEERANAYLGIPIMIGDFAAGVVSVQSYRENAFHDSHVRLLSTLTSSMGVALENARLYQETQRHAEELATMAEIGREISATLDLSTVLERIARRAMDLLHARDVVLRLLEADGNLPAAVAIGKYADIYKNWDAHLGRGLSGSVVQSGIAEIINDPENDPRVIDIAGTEEDKSTRAILFAPLLIGQSVIGVLSVWRDKIDVGPFTQADLDFAVSLARQAAIAIQNARLFAETQKRFTETEILRAANVALTKTLDLDVILGTLLDYLQQVVPYDSGSVFLLESETRLTARAARGYEQWTEIPEEAIGVSFDSKSLPHIRAVVEEQHTVIIPDVTQYPHWVVAPTAMHVRNWLAVPLVAGGRTIGLYSLDKAEPGFFTAEHQRLAENLATQAAIAIQNAALYQNQRVAREQAETLQAVTQALSRTLGLQEVFELILSELQKVVPYDSCSVQQLDGEDVVIVGGHGFPNLEELLGLRFQITAGDLSSHVIHSRLPYIVEDVSAQFPHFKNREHGEGRIHGWLGVPLIFGDRLIGMLALDKHEKAFYTSEHAQLAMAYAAQAAVAIENARLFDTERLAREQAEAQSKQMAALNRVAQAVTSTLDLQTVLEVAAREMVYLLNARSVGIGLLNDEQSELRVVAYYSQSDEPHAVGLVIPVEGNIATQQVIETGQSILIADAQNTPLQDEATRAVMRARNTHCILIVPLMARGEVIGTIGPDTDQPDRVFTPEEVQLAQTIANQMAGVIENARLFQAEREAHQQAETLRSIAQALNSSISLSEVFDVVLTEIENVIPYDSAAIFQVRNNRRTFAAGRGFTNFDELKHLSFEFTPEGDEIGYRVLNLLSPLILDDALDSYPQYFNVEPHVEGQIRSYMGIPVLLDNEMIGMITLDKKEAGYYTSHHAELAMAFAAQAAVAIQNARLFEETRERAAELATINTVSSALASELEVDHLIQLVGEQTRTTFKADIAYVALLNEATNMINFPYTYGEQMTPMRYGEGLTSKIIQTGQPLLLNSEVDRQTQQIGATIVGIESRSYLGVPILMGGKAVGVVSVQSTSQESAFDEADQRLLSTIAANVASALHNARLYKEAQESRAVAEDANKAKSTFLANMSHELRTPLNAIIGFTRIVRRKSDGLLPERQLENLDKVLASSEHLLGLINTLLDIAKIEAGRMDVIPGNFSIGALADQCTNLAMPLLKPRVILEKEVDANLGIIYSDQDKIKQIVLNLLSNAAKFTHEGEIILRLEKCDEGTLRISVTDSGIGISEEALGRIFDEFQQADASTTRQYGGTGLGLAISRSLALLLGGDLTVTSELGKGSTFSLTTPIYYGKRTTVRADPKSVAAQQTQAYSQSDSAKKRVLVIDDDPDAAYLLQESLNQNEFAVVGAPDGRAGLQLARETQPDAILLDILMPETDGWQVLNDLKMDKATVDIPVILLTIVDKKALGFKLGAAAYLLKPLNPVIVLDALRRVISGKEHPHKHVLVVDDDPNVAEMLRQTLPESEFALASAEDGEAGMLAIQSQRPDVILLDLMMPKLDGFGVIERLRTDPELRNIPIIVISAKELTEAESKTLKESVAFVMKKQGFNSDLLIQEINSVVNR